MRSHSICFCWGQSHASLFSAASACLQDLLRLQQCELQLGSSMTGHGASRSVQQTADSKHPPPPQADADLCPGIQRARAECICMDTSTSLAAVVSTAKMDNKKACIRNLMRCMCMHQTSHPLHGADTMMSERDNSKVYKLMLT